MFGNNLLYARVRDNLLTVKNISTGQTWEDEPILAIKHVGGQKQVDATGTAAKSYERMDAYSLHRPFTHDRTLIAEFDMAEVLLKHVIRQLVPGKIFRPSPQIVIHPIDSNKGELTQIEERAFLELCSGAGCRSAVMWTGHELTDPEVQEMIVQGKRRI